MAAKRPSLNEIETVLQKELRPEFASLGADRRWIHIIFLVVGAVMAAEIVAFFRLHSRPDNALPFIALTFGVGALFSRGSIKRFHANFGNLVMRKIANRFFPSFQYEPEWHVERALYDESQLFTSKLDGFEGSDFFKGEIGGAEFRFSELYCWYEEETGTGNNRRRERHTVFRGLFFVGDFHKEFYFRTTIKPDMAESLLGIFGRGLQRMIDGKRLVDLEDPEFEKLFVVTSDDQVEARYILTPVFMEKIRALRAKARYNIHLCFVNGKMFLAIETGREIFKPRLFGEIVSRRDLMQFIDIILMIEGVVREFLANPRQSAARPKMPPLPNVKK